MCSETCVGRIRYLGVLLYDADRIEEASSTEREVDLYRVGSLTAAACHGLQLPL
ncbi:hypothetical protein [Shigella flexneri]|uniref:hypothetical protein n=1 Tax=Shigella flexneri TaxID=623 RepID=UPI003CEC99C2